MLKEKLQTDVIKALKQKDELKVSTLRLLLGAVKNYEIDKQGTSYEANDEEVLEVLSREVKRHKESIKQFKAGGRDDLVQKETKELEVLQNYLPEQMSEEEISKIVENKITELKVSTITDMGKLMGALSPELKGKADMSTVSKVVREKLS